MTGISVTALGVKIVKVSKPLTDTIDINVLFKGEQRMKLTKLSAGAVSAVLLMSGLTVPAMAAEGQGTQNQPPAAVQGEGEKKEAEKFAPTVKPLTVDTGTEIKLAQVLDCVTIPETYPKEGAQPIKALAKDAQLPAKDAKPGEYKVKVTVTYKDQSVATVEVPVTLKAKAAPVVNPVHHDPAQKKDNEAFEPKVEPIHVETGKAVTLEQIQKAVTVPDYPKDKKFTVALAKDAQLPDCKTKGKFDVKVDVTYADKTVDHATVTVFVADKGGSGLITPAAGTLAAKFPPKAASFFVKEGTKITDKDIVDHVTIPNYPKDQKAPTITVTETQYTKGDTAKTGDVYIAMVTVTYPDGSKCQKVLAALCSKDGKPDKDVVEHALASGVPAESLAAFTGKGGDVVTPHQELTGDAAKFAPRVTELTVFAGKPVTAAQVVACVTVPNYKDKVAIEVADTSKLPDGNNSGVFEVPVRLTYADKSTATVNVKITVKVAGKDTPVTPGHANLQTSAAIGSMVAAITAGITAIGGGLASVFHFRRIKD